MLPALLPADARPFDVVALGECSVDAVARLAEPLLAGGKARLRDFVSLPGGQAATAAVTCARQGYRARFVGAVGLDDRAATIEQALCAEGVDPQLVRCQGARSRGALILVAPDGDRTVLEDRDEALCLSAAGLDLATTGSGRILLLDASSVDASIAAARDARRHGVRTIVDVDRPGAGVDELLREIDLIVVAETFPEACTGVRGVGAALAELAREFSAATLIATLGAEGALALVAGRELRLRPPPVPVEDTTGAGDAFRGGLACGWLRLEEAATLEDLLRHANATAALNCRAAGAQAGLPTRAEVEGVCNSSGGPGV